MANFVYRTTHRGRTPQFVLTTVDVMLLKTKKCARVYATTNDALWDHVFCAAAPKKLTLSLVSMKIELFKKI